MRQSAGVAIPVSGIKTTESTGIGEFLDLKKVVHIISSSSIGIIITIMTRMIR
jgi:hypothetical protein